MEDQMEEEQMISPFERTAAKILCCLCGIPIDPNPANMCLNCLRQQVDISEDIPRQLSIEKCKSCGRWFDPPSHWVEADPESRQLLSLCLKRLKSLNSVKLVDASFLWTEPHSRRIKVKIVIQKQVLGGAILEQAVMVEYHIGTHQCDACTKAQTPHTWSASVQVRQRVQHKRTLLFLEQLILKHGAHENVIAIENQPTGLDFFFAKKNHALRFTEYLQTVLCVRVKTSEKLISADFKSNTATFKYTYAVEISPVCKDDLAFMPHQTATSLGGVCPLVLCLSVGTSFTFVDPFTMNIINMQGMQFWKNPFSSLLNSRQLTEYTVLDVEPCGVQHGKYSIANVTVARTSDFGRNDTYFLGRTHLGAILNPGDLALGYDMTSANLQSLTGHDDTLLNNMDLPDVILVRKTYARRRRHKRNRIWKLKALQKTEGMDEDEAAAAPVNKKTSRRNAKVAEKEGEDYEQFLRDVEEDPELRGQILLYKDNLVISSAKNRQEDTDDMMTEDEDDFPEIEVDDLLEDVEAMGINNEQE